MIKFDIEQWHKDRSIFVQKIDAIDRINNYNIRKDLVIMLKNLDRHAFEITTEEIYCRRKNKRTSRHISLMKEFAEMKQNFTEHLMWAMLM